MFIEHIKSLMTSRYNLQILSASICQFVPLNVLLVSSLILSISYEIILEGFGFKFYIFSSERRHNIIDMNKEGIFSMVGSYCLYVLSLQLGKWIHDHYKRFETSKIHVNFCFMHKIFFITQEHAQTSDFEFIYTSYKNH